MKRKQGYYWVQVFKDDDWDIALWSTVSNCFYFCDDEREYEEVQMFAIDEKQIVRLP